jgi:hypothetical protein
MAQLATWLFGQFYLVDAGGNKFSDREVVLPGSIEYSRAMRGELGRCLVRKATQTKASAGHKISRSRVESNKETPAMHAVVDFGSTVGRSFVLTQHMPKRRFFANFLDNFHALVVNDDRFASAPTLMELQRSLSLTYPTPSKS